MNLLWEHRKKFFACLGVLSTLALGLLSGQAQAATASTTFSVTATNLAFGSYTGALTNATSTIRHLHHPSPAPKAQRTTSVLMPGLPPVRP